MPKRSAVVEEVEFNGVIYRRYPESKQWADRMYFTPGYMDRKRGFKRLHQEIWQATHGLIPVGHEIHHVDGDPLNNDPSNLDCVPSAQHVDIHRERISDERMEQLRDAMDHARKYASVWHGSDAGRAWHAEHGRATWKNREPVEYTCEQCGRKHKTLAARGQGRFCSNKCKAAYRRASGVDDEDRACERCGKVFRVNRYSKQRYCSRSCGCGRYERKA